MEGKYLEIDARSWQPARRAIFVALLPEKLPCPADSLVGAPLLDERGEQIGSVKGVLPSSYRAGRFLARIRLPGTTARKRPTLRNELFKHTVNLTVEPEGVLRLVPGISLESLRREVSSGLLLRNGATDQ